MGLSGGSSERILPTFCAKSNVIGNWVEKAVVFQLSFVKPKISEQITTVSESPLWVIRSGFGILGPGYVLTLGV